MIVKIKMLDTTSANHPLLGKPLSGYMEHTPELGHPLLLWYNENNDAAYLRTTRVNKLVDYSDLGSGEKGWIAQTDHSTYKVKMLNIRHEDEGMKAAEVLDGLVRNVIDMGE